MRGFLGWKRILSLRQYEIMQLIFGKSVLFIQSIFCRHHGRIRAQNQRKKLSSIIIQQIFWCAQEKAESRASMICQEMKDSEKELRLLENELCKSS